MQTLGHIFGLSDAILGLTVFGIFNSLGDLVANATVAVSRCCLASCATSKTDALLVQRMGYPSMAIAACYGGPMLNILLGLGLSRSYVIYQAGGKPYHVEVGKTLFTSGISLLLVLVASLILVPMNGYWMNRKLGAGLILAFTIVLTINICVEVWL